MGGSKRSAAAALAAGFVASFPASALIPASAGGDTDYQGSFSGNVDSGGAVTKFSTVRCDTDGYSVGITVDDFTSPTGRQMNFRPVVPGSFDYQPGSSWADAAKGETTEMGLSQHCWKFAAYVSPGRDTNGLPPGDGVTSFDGQLKY